MRSVLMALVALALLGLNAWASVPDPDYCSVGPLDSWTSPKLIGVPTDARAEGDYTIHVAAYGGTPIANAEVYVEVNSACDGLCICDAWVNPVYTDVNGDCTIHVRFGGCCEMAAAATVFADGTPIRSYPVMASPDWNGVTGDCQVLLGDFTQFATAFGSADPCSDLAGGDGSVLLGDFTMFATYFGVTCTNS